MPVAGAANYFKAWGTGSAVHQWVRFTFDTSGLGRFAIEGLVERRDGASIRRRRTLS